MFYVYVYRDPRPTKNRQVVYVGKGTGDRMYAHWTKRVHKNKAFGAFLALLRRNNSEPIIEQVAQFDDEASAFAEEVRLIRQYGRRDLATGALFNLTDGGEGLAGAVRTVTWRDRIVAALRTPEAARRNSARMKALWATPDYRGRVVAQIRAAMENPAVQAKREAAKALFTQTPEFRSTMRRVSQAQWADPAYAAKVAEGQRKVQGTTEARAAKSESSAAGWADQEIRRKRHEGIKAARGSAESRAKTSAQATAQWADPEYVARQRAAGIAAANREDVRAAKAAAAKALWADPAWKAKMMAARAAKKASASPPTVP